MQKNENMFGSTELILIVIIALFLFGPDKIPEIARTLGKVMGDFKRAMKDAEDELAIETKESIKDTIKIE